MNSGAVLNTLAARARARPDLGRATGTTPKQSWTYSPNWPLTCVCRIQDVLAVPLVVDFSLIFDGSGMLPKQVY